MTPAQSRQTRECLHYLQLVKPAEMAKRAQWLRDEGYPEAAIQAAIKEMSE